MKNTFRENVFVYEDFSIIFYGKENELHRKCRFLGVYGKCYSSSSFKDTAKLMLPLDLARLRVYKKDSFFIYLRK